MKIFNFTHIVKGKKQSWNKLIYISVIFQEILGTGGGRSPEMIKRAGDTRCSISTGGWEKEGIAWFLYCFDYTWTDGKINYQDDGSNAHTE